jgi:1,4-alpha-glucan branching enzyme/maltooligosyltrehalose trehalohydrolase
VEWLARHTALLALRAEHIVPRLAGTDGGAKYEAIGAHGIAVDWTLGDGSRLHLRANFGGTAEPGIARARGTLLHSEGDCGDGPGLAPWSGLWTLEPA